jgi:biopolymer transport protein ExbD
MKKSLSLWVFVLFAVSILTVQFVYAEAPASSDDTKVTKKSSETYVYIKEGGKKYHKKGCHMIKKDAKEMNLTEAIKKGYTPCKICNTKIKDKKD